MDADIKRAIMEIAKKHGNPDRESTCQYKARSRKHCNITTNKSCKRCKFYQPTTQTVFKACYDEIIKASNLVDLAAEKMEIIRKAEEETLENASSAADAYADIQAAALEISASSSIITAAVKIGGVNASKGG